VLRGKPMGVEADPTAAAARPAETALNFRNGHAFGDDGWPRLGFAAIVTKLIAGGISGDWGRELRLPFEIADMTISVTEYFRTRKDDRKKETRYLNVINKDSCTSCQSCATVCPVDCIYEVPSSVPGQSYHQIDTSRCIGCQMCYRSPSDSSEHYTLTICPWNAIDMLHNPNVSPDSTSILLPYWQGDDRSLPWPKLEEYGYQLFDDGQVFIPTNRKDLLDIMAWFAKPDWLYSEEGETVPIAKETSRDEFMVKFDATGEGRELLDCIFPGWKRIWMD